MTHSPVLSGLESIYLVLLNILLDGKLGPFGD